MESKLNQEELYDIMDVIESFLSESMFDAIEAVQIEEAQARSLADDPPPAEQTHIDVIKRLSTFSANASGKVCLSEKCLICIESFKDGENVMALPCDHGFHVKCVMPWIKTNTRCPTCRADFSKTEKTENT